MTNCIEVKGLVKHYPLFTLGPVDLAVPTGSIVGLIGENGAGKTTLLKCLLGVIAPTDGQVSLLGRDVGDRDVMESVGVVLDASHFHDVLRAADLGPILSRVYRQWDQPLFRSLLKRFGLPLNLYLKEFSRGMKMKLSLAAVAPLLVAALGAAVLVLSFLVSRYFYTHREP